MLRNVRLAKRELTLGYIRKMMAAAPEKPRIKVMVGECSDGSLWGNALPILGWGRMVVETRPTPYPGEIWGFDNGAWLYFKRGIPFDEHGYSARLERAMQAEVKPLFSVIPDIVQGGMESLAFSLKWWERIADYPTDWYLAVQDGMEPEIVREVLPLFAGLFMGGSNDFKLQAGFWCDMAHAAGKQFHYGRCGTLKKLAQAVEIGADSLDSAFPLFTRKRFLSFAYHWLHGNCQTTFPPEVL
jgi:hypothetical protein